MGVRLLGKMKLYELAKEMEVPSKELLEQAKEMGINIKSHLSVISDEDVKNLKDKYQRKSASNTSKKEDKKPKKESTPNSQKKDNPVIIRREVIIEEDGNKEKKQEPKHSDNKNPFVQRNQKKDYNIVYRNKPTKPMTVSELFGLNKDEKKVENKKQEDVEKKEAMKVEEKKVEPKKVEQKVEQKIEPKVQENVVHTRNQENNMNRKNDFRERRNQSTDRGNYQPHNNRNNDRNGYQKRDGFRQNRNNDGQNGFQRRDNNRYQNNNGEKNWQRDNRNNGQNNFRNNNQNGRNGYNNGGNRFGNNNRRPLDEKGIEKNIKNIMTVETNIEEKSAREYNRNIDKQKNNNKYDENRSNKKKNNRRNQEDYSINEKKLNNLKQRNNLSNMFEDQEDSMLDYYDLTTQRGRKGKKKNTKGEERTKQKIFKLTEITIPESISVKDLATELKKTSSEVIMKLMSLGIMATLNNNLDFDTAFLVASEFGVTANKKQEVKEEDILFDESEDKENELKERPPVVVVMGHVDHGKTSLLDVIRKTNVIGGEAGGITQAIGAYQVKVNDRDITFLDTPGHEAFTQMRARGAQITDIAILVVAANDGVMPQTVEAINHAKSAGIPIIVAINKIDLPDANPQKVKEELMQYELVPEEWGGDTIYVEISAKKNLNIDQLLEMVLLEADVLELKANPTKQAKGAVIEARLDKNKGAIASVLVQRGKLDVGDTVVVGTSIGRIRSMVNDKGKKVKSAGPSTPVEIMGLTEVPQAGDIFYEVKDEKMAKHLIERRKRQAREKSINQVSAVTLDNLFGQMEEGKLKQLNLIVKADVQGSVEALKQSLEKLSNEEVRVKVIHSAAGAVTESDVTLAKVSNAIIIAFNVRPVATAKNEAEKDEVQIKQYSVIYQAIDDVEAAMKGMLDPKFEEEVIGTAEIRQIFKISNVGTIGGAMVLTGKIARNAGVRVIRDDVVIHDGKLISLKRFKDDAKEVAKDFECGIQLEKYNDIKEGDILEAYIMKEIKRLFCFLLEPVSFEYMFIWNRFFDGKIKKKGGYYATKKINK